MLRLPRIGLLALLHLLAETPVQRALLLALFTHGCLLDLQELLFGDAFFGHFSDVEPQRRNERNGYATLRVHRKDAKSAKKVY